MHKEEARIRRQQKYCCEEISKIENYTLAKKDNFIDWDVHHRLETHNSDGEKRLVDLSRAELIALGIYYNRPPEELIFMKSEGHMALHQKGKHLSKEAKKHISEARKGRKISEEHKRHISEAKKNMSDETKRKLSEAHKGHKISEETRRKISETMKSQQTK